MDITVLMRYVEVQHSVSFLISVVDVAPGIKICLNQGKGRVPVASRGL